MYVCGEDYWVILSPEGLPAKMAVLEFARPGSYFLEVIYEDGTVELEEHKKYAWPWYLIGVLIIITALYFRKSME